MILFDVRNVIAAASMFGCLCMLFVCAAQFYEGIKALGLRARAPCPWERQAVQAGLRTA